jgi:hypothetical protein
MTVNISGVGFTIQLLASSTFPVGLTLSQFADDIDPFDIPSIKLAEASMGLNGDLLKASKASPIAITIGMVPAGTDDQNLQILAKANLVGKGKISANDVITLIGNYPDGRVVTLDGGFLSDAIIDDAIASAGRYKSKPYTFQFENTTSN